jgi:lactoylglutathione lyase/methylmalonyl-CoA/ethylmalonyl-CoA epimerase
MIKNIDHIGIVVENTENTFGLFHSLFGFEVLESLVASEQGFKSTLISKGMTTIELIEPVTPDGPIARFLQKRGEGVHHISLLVDDMEQAVSSLRAKGVQMIGEKPEQVTKTAKSIFIHPRSTGGILFELVQRSDV